MNILLAASEVFGFAKTGGLADVAGALPAALARLGHRCAVVMPLYRAARDGPQWVEPTAHALNLPVGGQTVTGRLWQSRLPGTDVPVYLIEQPNYFERDDPAKGYGLYQYTLPSGQKRDYPDNCARFVFFCRAVLETARLLDWWPDVLHANDWQCGLVPAYLAEEYRELPAFASMKSLFTVHNLAYQGLFWHLDLPLTGLGWRLFNYRQLEFHGHLNFLKAGLVFADRLSTVSPTYAREIQTPYYGCGLQGVLLERSDRVTGIVNGVDYGAWDPASDSHISARYDVASVGQGKPLCKQALQQALGLPQQAGTPLLAMVARLVEQKGIDLVLDAAEGILATGAQFVVLGEGHPSYHQRLRTLEERHPQQVAARIGFDEVLAHQIEAGADVFLMPSLYEPSGLNQLYSLKYGTVPVVRATGGLADTVTDTTPETLAARTATGFRFVPYAADALQQAVHRALALYRDQPDHWLQVVQNGMRQDWSWDRSAKQYEQVYASLIEARGDS
jgi:starch synthase